ncbi:hypothetical protein [Salinisphaera sp. SWV1]|uniref:hypothetical protein n=1 Tax=Salinisphaera sp. SWV1 TaxID=3454139 RepID=UPI003F824EF5
MSAVAISGRRGTPCAADRAPLARAGAAVVPCTQRAPACRIRQNNRDKALWPVAVLGIIVVVTLVRGIHYELRYHMTLLLPRLPVRHRLRIVLGIFGASFLFLAMQRYWTRRDVADH